MRHYLVATALAVAVGATTLGAGLQAPPAGAQGQAPGGPGGGRGAGGGGGQRGPVAPAGPPAPVPPEVAMQRPTTDELTRINAALKRFVDTNNSADAAVLKKYADMISVPAPRPNAAIAPVPTGPRTDPRHLPFVETAKTGDFDILFAGDSITDWWQMAAPQGGTDVQKKYFGDVKVANFAIAGDTTQGVLWGLQNGEGQGRKPKAVMLMIGTNNTGPNTAPEIAEGVGAVVYELRKDFPDAKILLLAIFPRGAGPTDANRMKNDEVNKIIAKLHDGKNVFFKNINDKFLNPQGQLIGFRPDNLHPVAEGYEIWATAVADTLKGWVK
jgi:lysophospholipase L1-like esterase